MTNFFWSIPNWVKDFFKPKGKTKLTITAYKDGSDWYFNLPPITWKESLVFSEALNELAKGANEVKLTISSKPIEGAEKIWWFQSDPCWMEANIYYWKDHEIWLCPWNQWYFGEVHENLWFTVSSLR